MTAECRLEQTKAISELTTRDRCFLIGGMGSGKTRTTVGALAKLNSAHVLIVSTPAVIKQWPAELDKWGLAHATVGAKDWETKGADGVMLCTFGMLPHIVKRSGSKWKLSRRVRHLIVDESRKLAGFRLRSGSIQGKLAYILARQAARVWLLTADPCAESVIDAWAQMMMIDNGDALGPTMTEFEARYCYFAEGDAEHRTPLPNPDAAALIGAEIAKRAVALQSVSVLTSQLIETVIPCSMPAHDLRTYRKLARDHFVAGKVASNAGHVYSMMHQLASGACYEPEGACKQPIARALYRVESDKSARLSDLINRYASAGEAVLASYVYAHQLPMIEAAAKGAGVTAELLTAKNLAAWNGGKVRVGMVHARSLGHGVNLQHGGRVLIFFCENFSRDAHNQLLERLGPQRQTLSGFTRDVHVYYLRTAGTVDMTLPDVRSGKQDFSDAILNMLGG